MKHAPSANYQEVVGLWKCHNEKYDQFFDEDTRLLCVPSNTLVFNFNTIEVHASIDFDKNFPHIQVKDDG